jgi:hypothetical protein
MGENFKALMDNKKEWSREDREDRHLELLSRAIVSEPDVSADDILATLVELSKRRALIPEAVYRRLADRGPEGWLAARAAEAARARSKYRRMEACRWLRWGRANDRASEADLETLHALLTDKDDDVRSVALYPLAQFATDRTSQVIPVILRWIPKLKMPQQASAVACLSPALDSDAAQELADLQLGWLRDAKKRGPFAGAIEAAIQQQPPSRPAARACWDLVLEPAVRAVVGGDWQRASAIHDQMIAYCMGTLLAFDPEPDIIERAEAAVALLTGDAAPPFSPSAIVIGPWRAFGVFSTAVWKDYPSWLEAQSEKIHAAAPDASWTSDIEHMRTAREELRRAPTVDDIPPSELDVFRRAALAFARDGEGRA